MRMLTSHGPGVLLVVMLVHPTNAQLSDSAQVSLLTIGSGEAVYSLWGHSALRIYDPIQGLDIAYNYGTFDFDDTARFVARFAYGRLDYLLARQHYTALVASSWHGEGRAVVEQVLNLNGSQRNALFAYLENNARPENRVYRYNYFSDNCSTRIRDVLEEVLADPMLFRAGAAPPASFRQLMRRYLARRPLLDLAMNLALGLPADAVATGRQRLFLPLELMRAAGDATVQKDGRLTGLVTRTNSVYGSLSALPPRALWVHILAWTLCVLVLALTAHNSGAWRFADAALLAAAGFAGLSLFLLWFASLHAAAAPNLNVAWAWPTHLFVAWKVLRGTAPVWHRFYLYTAAASSVSVAVSAMLLPAHFPSALIPLLLLFACRCAAMAHRSSQHAMGTAYGI